LRCLWLSRFYFWQSGHRRWEVSAYANNLTNEQYLIDAGNVGGSFGIPTFIAGNPRRIGVTTSLRW